MSVEILAMEIMLYGRPATIPMSVFGHIDEQITNLREILTSDPDATIFYGNKNSGPIGNFMRISMIATPGGYKRAIHSYHSGMTGSGEYFEVDEIEEILDSIRKRLLYLHRHTKASEMLARLAQRAGKTQLPFDYPYFYKN